MNQLNPITVKVPMIMESIMIIRVTILPNESAGHLSRRIGVSYPSALCRWPLRARLVLGENVYQFVKTGGLIYVHSKDLTDISTVAHDRSPILSSNV